MSLLFKAPDWDIDATAVVKDAETAKATSGQIHKSRKRKRANGSKETKSINAKKDAIKNAQATLESLVESFETIDDQTPSMQEVKKNARDDKLYKKRDQVNGKATVAKHQLGSKDIAHISTPLPKKQKKMGNGKDVSESNIRSVLQDEAHISEPLSKKQKKKQKVEGKVTKEIASEPVAKPASTSLTPLQEKMQKKLTGSRFRWINEQLYTTSSKDAVELFKEQPNMFEEYHCGFRSQASAWPSPPLQHYISLFQQTLPVEKNTIIADMGCGDANLASSLPKHRILSYDLICPPGNKHIVPCDIANVPLPDHFVDVVLFCLSLMGTNWVDFVSEGHRILRSPHGVLHIAEVKSRFTDLDAFVSLVEKIGFKLESKDDSSDKMFVYFKFKRASHRATANLAEQGKKLLKPCIYKKR